MSNEKLPFEEGEEKKFNFEIRPYTRKIPTEQECLEKFFDGCRQCTLGYLPTMFFINYYYDIFGHQLERKDLSFRFNDGVPELKTGGIFADVTSDYKIEVDFFQTLYDRAITVFRFDDSSYLAVYANAIVGIAWYKDYLRISSVMTNDQPEDVMWIFEGATQYKDSIDKTKFSIAVYSEQMGITKMEQDLKKIDVDIETNYNDDIPYDKIKNILTEDGKSLLLFYGEPGTGKSTIIRKLIGEVDRRFIFMDPSIVSTISNVQFISFLSDIKGSVIVLEDCEKLLKSREDGFNATIGTVLNLTDGIVGDSFGVKFICTFNSKIDDVDKALLRKGRLSLKYEFGKLSIDKVKKIYPDAKDDMTLADAYFAAEENDFSKKNEKRIGF